MAITITCPSGLVGEVRGFKVKEANILADKAALKKGTAYDTILSGCWLNTVDPGPYPWLEAGKPVDWSKALVCDRFYALLQIRAATFGEDYAFKLKCQNSACGEAFEWEIKVADLPIKQLPEFSKDVLRGGSTRFETTLSDGKRCWFKLLNGAAEAAAANSMRLANGRRIVFSLMQRIEEVEGVPRAQLSRYLDDLDLGELFSLVEQFDEADGGVETLIDVECPHCGTTQGVQLPFGQDFFSPPKKKTALL
jgi:hypothetical protein